MNLLLLDDSLRDAHVFADSVNDSTQVIRYTSSLLEEIQGKGSSFDRVGIAFVKTSSFLGKPMFEQEAFFLSLIETFRVKQIDFLACDTLNDPLYKAFYAKLPVLVGASDDKTGNLKYGGDWVMESTGEDIEKVYFTKSIEYYSYLLDPNGGNYIIVTLADGYAYGMGENGESAFGISNNGIISTPTILTKDASPITGITKVTSGYYHNVYLKDEKLYGIGHNNQFPISSGGDLSVPTEIPLGVSGPVQDVLCSGWYTVAIINGKLYGRGSAATPQTSFQLLLVDGSDNKVPTKLYGGGENYFFVSMGEKLYTRGAQNSTATAQGGVNSEGKSPSYSNTTLVDFPSGRTTLPELIACGDNHALFVFGGQLYGLGKNAAYSLGGGSLPTDVTSITPLQYNSQDISGVTAVAASYQRSWFVKNNQLYGMGKNFFGELGPGFVYGAAFGIHLIPTPAGTIQEISANAMSDGFLYLRMSNNNLYGIGISSFGQLGESVSQTDSFVLIDTGVTSITSGYQFGVYIKNNSLYGIGRNYASVLTLPLLNKIGTLSPILMNSQPVIMNKYSTGTSHSWADIGGVLYACGYNGAADDGNSAGLGTVARTNKYLPVQLPVGHTGTITFIRTSQITSIVVKGNVIYSNYKRNWYASTPPPPLRVIPFPLDASGITITGTIQGIDCTDIHAPGGTILVIIETKLYGLGANHFRILGNIPINQSGEYITAFSPILFGTTPCTNVTKVACSSEFTIFVMNGLLYGMGTGLSPVLTYPAYNVVTNIPLPVSGTIDSIECGFNYFYVVIDGNLYGAGSNDYGQLGSSAANPQSTLIPLRTQGVAITGVTDIKCYKSTALITKGKNLYGWGKNDQSQLGSARPATVTALSLITDQLFVKGVSITDMSPLSGTTDRLITVTGEGFMTVKAVYLDDEEISPFTKEATTITFSIPEGNGEHFLRLIDNDDVVKVFSTKFAYRNPIQLMSISSYTGTKNKILSITASNMTNLARIKFNGVATTSFYRITDTLYNVIVPDSTSGAVILEDIYNIASTPPISFTYQNSTLVNGFISPAISNTEATISGKARDTLTLTGTFLSNTLSVYFGNSIATLVRKSTDNVVATVPVGLGTVSIRIYDNNNNMTTCAKQFAYQLASVVQGAVPAIVQATTIDASGQKYFSILEGDSYFVVRFVSDISYNKLYSNALQPIRGIACSGTTLYFCDPSNNRIQSIPSTTTTMLEVATPVLTRGTMVPEALKVKDAKLWIVCTNTGVSTNDAIVVVNGSVFSKTYADFAGYSLQGIAYNPKVSDTNLYISAVLYTQPNKILGEGTGRVFRTDAAGGSADLTFIQGLTNPIDLTFSNGYLVVDGIINVYSPTGELVSSLNTLANSIVTEIRLGQEVVSFTTVNIVTGSTIINEMTVPEYIPSVFQLTSAYSPNKGPKGTVVTIVGYNMTMGDVTDIQIRDASSDLTTFTSSSGVYHVNANVIVLRMPEKPAAGTEVTIVVNPVTGSPLEYAFSYQSPDLVNIIPLFSGETKYFHFTGNNLQNVQFVEFVDTSTTELSVNKLPVRNVTATSFNCSFVTVPINTTRCLLLDAFGAVTIEDANYFSLSSETCFLGGTLVMTDQGEVPIDKLDRTYTIDQREIVAITKTRYNKNTLILLEKDSLKKNYPTRETVITHKHKIYYKGKMKRAEYFLKKDGVHMIPYKNQYLYNVLLETHEVMRVNGLICETLYPKNPIAKFFTTQASIVDLSLDWESIHAESFD